jgi:putative ABC transport system ATP-binding protein
MAEMLPSPRTAAPIIEIRGLRKVYRRDRQEVTVLDGIDLDIPDGAFEALMGPSGSGKTTLLNLMAGIDSPTSGSVRVAGEDIGRLGETRRARWRARNIGFIFQFYNLMPVLTAAENVELPLLLTRLSRAERKRRVEVALKLVALQDRMDHTPRQLSGGQQQRVAIARAIVADPKIIVADEPTGDLDRKSADEIMHLIHRLVKEYGKTVLMVTHDPVVAKQADMTLHLEKGVLVESGESQSVAAEV